MLATLVDKILANHASFLPKPQILLEPEKFTTEIAEHMEKEKRDEAQQKNLFPFSPSAGSVSSVVKILQGLTLAHET